MQNKSNFISEFSTKITNAIFIFGLFASIFFVILYIYRLFYPADGPYPINMLDAVYKYYYKMIFIGIIFILLFGLSLILKKKIKFYMLMFYLTAIILVYAFEIYLTFYRDNFNIYFGEDRFIGREYYGGVYSNNKNNNNFVKFSTNGMDFIVINLDWESDINELKWANKLLEAYKRHRAIIVSHYILGGDFKNENDNDTFYTQGENIYNALKDNQNFFLMLSAHILSNSENSRTDIHNKGKDIYRVHSLLANYQTRPNGGNGWLRILQFSPDNNEIRVKTYSPLLDKWETDANSEFTLFYNMSDRLLPSIKDKQINSSKANEFAIIVLPDTQYYSENYPSIFKTQTQWIVDNRDEWNIVYVAHTGDIVNIYSSIPQWKNADSALKLLEEAVSEKFPNGIPYGVVPGNHDFLIKNKSMKETFRDNVKKIIKIYNLRFTIGLIPLHKIKV